MIITPAQRTAIVARALRSRNARRRPLPPQIYPHVLEDQYASALVKFTDALFKSFEPFLDEVPSLLSSAVAAARVDGFRADAGEGKRIRELIAAARARMNRSLFTPELERLADEFATKTATHQRIQLGRQVKAALGADVFIQDRRLVPLTEAFVNANVGLIKGLSDEMAAKLEKATLLAVQDARPYDDFAEEIQDAFGFGEARATLIARDQIGKFYGQTNAARQRELGVTHFIWRTSNDERVRDEHRELEGERFSYDEGGHPEEGLPGEPIQCRCSAEPDFTAILDEL